MPDSQVPSADLEALAQLDARITVLRADYDRAYQALAVADAALRSAMAERVALVARLRSLTVPPPAPVASLPPDTIAATGPETSTRTVQNVLFVLGGVLLGLAAIVFTAVAWATYGITGRAVILGVLTLLALTAPPVATVRRLRATGETFAAIGLLLLVLDGYAVWYVNLADARSLPPDRYTGLVAAGTAVFALGYGLLTRLTTPSFVALIVAQPVIVLLAPVGSSYVALSLLASASAAANALVAAASRASRSSSTLRTPSLATHLTTRQARGLTALAWTAFSAWALAAAYTAIAAETTATAVAESLWAGCATIALSLVLLLGTSISSIRPLRTIAAGGVVLAATAAALFTGALAWPGHGRLLLTATALAVAISVRAASVAMPEWLRPGPRWVAGAVAGLGLVALTPAVLRAAISTVAGAYPFWSAPLTATGPNPPYLTWSLPVAALGLAAALLVVAPRWTNVPVAVGATVLGALSVPACVRLPWWAPPAVSLGAAAVLTLTYVAVRPSAVGRGAVVGAALLIGDAVLVGDAVLISTARPGQTALTLGGVALLGFAVAIVGRPDRVGAVAFAIALVTLPPVAGSALRAVELAPWWAVRAAVAAAAVQVLVVGGVRLLPRRTTYRSASFVAAIVSAVVWPLLAMTVGEESAGIYSGLSLVLLAGAVVALPSAGSRPARAAALSAVAPIVTLAISTAPAVLAVSVYPYGWLGSIWSGPPTGTGLVPDSGGVAVAAVDAIALWLVAVAGAAGLFAATRRPAAALGGLGLGGPTALLASLAAAGTPWPLIPLASLGLGVGLVLSVTLASLGGWRAAVLGGQGLVYIGAGVAECLGVEWATLTSVGAVVVTFCVVGAAGRTVGWRILGCVTAVVAAAIEASAAGQAARQSLRTVAILILAIGVVALFAGALLRRDPVRRAEATATEAAATGAALVAFTVSAGWPGWAAAICAVWGVAVGVRAVVPGITAGVRRAYAVVGCGLEVVAWWLLLSDQDVRWLEAYTLPLAAVALFAGWAASRARAQLRSWVAYGPALLAGFLPSLAMVMGTVGDVWRRLALFTAAMVVVVLGSVHRLRAPVVVGGVVLIVVAVHELALVWQLLPGWIPLGVCGAILLLLAITYERRRRDLRRLRDVLHRMT